MLKFKKSSIMLQAKLKTVLSLSVIMLLAGGLQVQASSKKDKDAEVTEQQQAKRITGTVLDANGEALIGASVSIKGTSRGTVTDVDGKFSLEANAGETLEIRYIGYTPQEVKVGSQSNYNVTLSEDAAALDEVVVTGMGITRAEKTLGYAATTISAEELTKTGTSNFGTALYGKAAGVRIQTSGGGSAAAVSINVRGLSSLTGNNQPLVIVDGMPIRNGNTGNNSNNGMAGDFSEFGAEGRIRSNGMVDINPEDIANLTILKGAAATALYGSEASNGVLIITSKKAKTGKLNIEFSGQLMVNTPVTLPPVQTEYGTGGTGFWASQMDAEGFILRKDKDGKEWQSPTYNYMMWGPKYDGRDVLFYDGSIRKYSPITTQPWKEIFRNGSFQNYSLAISSASEVSNNRLAYTFSNEIPNALEGSYHKHNFKMVGTLNLSKFLSVDYNANYIIQQWYNRQGSQWGAYNYFGGTFDAFIDYKQLKQKYVTSLGYRNVNKDAKSLTPDESWYIGSGARDNVANMLWSMYHNHVYETDNRLIASITPKIKFRDDLMLSMLIGGDLTNNKQIVNNESERPLELYPTDPGGYYSAYTRRANLYYADFRLNYNTRLSDMFGINLNLGWTAKKSDEYGWGVKTRGGLTIRNWYSLNASRETPRVNDELQFFRPSEYVKQAFYGTATFEIADYLFFDLTGRQEKISTLKKGANTYFYPSASMSFVFTDLFKDKMPEWYNFGKLRASYGVVGNPPDIYAANVAYAQQTLDGVTFNTLPGLLPNSGGTTLGNENIVPEKTFEWEVGMESKLFNNRLGIDFAYYNRDIKDMILGVPQPITSGAGSILVNAGRMVNKGWELSLYGTPVQTKEFSLDVIFNISQNKNKILSLADGIDFMQHGMPGNHGGGLDLRSYVGSAMGDIYAQVYETDENGNYLTTDDGYYINKDGQTLHKVGNAMYKFIGGLGTTLTYKNVTLDVQTDFRIGGDIANVLWHLSTAVGSTPYTLQHRDEAHGGLAFYFDKTTGEATAANHSDATGPNGERIYHNGFIQPGIRKSDGQPNDKILEWDYTTYYTYNWGTDDNQMQYHDCVTENTYWKMREIALGYKVPENLIKKAGIKDLSVSLYGRNLFYLLKTLRDYDVETQIGTDWKRQAAIDGGTNPQRTFGFSFRASF